eukprot:364503-Chlamydomonas_euryale.AAC.10
MARSIQCRAMRSLHGESGVQAGGGRCKYTTPTVSHEQTAIQDEGLKGFVVPPTALDTHFCTRLQALHSSRTGHLPARSRRPQHCAPLAPAGLQPASHAHCARCGMAYRQARPRDKDQR